MKNKDKICHQDIKTKNGSQEDVQNILFHSYLFNYVYKKEENLVILVFIDSNEIIIFTQ